MRDVPSDVWVGLFVTVFLFPMINLYARWKLDTFDTDVGVLTIIGQLLGMVIMARGLWSGKDEDEKP